MWCADTIRPTIQLTGSPYGHVRSPKFFMFLNVSEPLASAFLPAYINVSDEDAQVEALLRTDPARVRRLLACCVIVHEHSVLKVYSSVGRQTSIVPTGLL